MALRINAIHINRGTLLSKVSSVYLFNESVLTNIYSYFLISEIMTLF